MAAIQEALDSNKSNQDDSLFTESIQEQTDRQMLSAEEFAKQETEATNQKIKALVRRTTTLGLKPGVRWSVSTLSLDAAKDIMVDRINKSPPVDLKKELEL